MSRAERELERWRRMELVEASSRLVVGLADVPVGDGRVARKIIWDILERAELRAKGEPFRKWLGDRLLLIVTRSSNPQPVDIEEELAKRGYLSTVAAQPVTADLLGECAVCHQKRPPAELTAVRDFLRCHTCEKRWRNLQEENATAPTVVTSNGSSAAKFIGWAIMIGLWVVIRACAG